MIYVINEWNGRSYKCHEMDIDCSNRWNIAVHNNNHTPILYFKTCGYCGTEFRNRAELFYHLGFMNIDIRNDYEKEYYLGDTPQFKRIRHVDEFITHLFMSKLTRKRLRDDKVVIDLQVEELSKRMKSL